MLCKTEMRVWCVCLTVIALVSYAKQAGADVITPVNGSFEADVVTSEMYGYYLAFGNPTGWTQLSGATTGVIHRPIGDINQSQTPLYAAPTGTDNYQLFGLEYTTTVQSIGIYQDLGTMNSGEKYTFDATLLSGSEGYGCSYRASFFDVTANKELAHITQADFNPALLGTLKTVAATFSYSAGASDAGDTLRLILTATGDSSSVGRLGIDDVTVTTSAVPEPGAMAIVVSGVFGLLAYAWRKR